MAPLADSLGWVGWAKCESPRTTLHAFCCTRWAVGIQHVNAEVGSTVYQGEHTCEGDRAIKAEKATKEKMLHHSNQTPNTQAQQLAFQSKQL